VAKPKRRVAPVEEVLKRLMLELLYPAVLGAVLFAALDVADRADDSIVQHFGGTFDHVITLKLALLLVTALFYCCDYVYIMLTRNFRLKFFFYDCFFLLGLYITLAALHVVRERELSEVPECWVVAIVYIAFFLIYRKWDRFERRQTEDHDEQVFYAAVIRWENWSMGALGLTLVTAGVYRQSSCPLLLLLGVLFLSTCRCFQLVKRKRFFATVADL